MTTIMAPFTKNPDLVAVQKMLSADLDKLVEAQEAATDPATVKALGIEIRELAFRSTNVQQLLFRQQTQKITDAVVKIRKADADLKKAIAAIDKLNNFIKTITAFLGLVDKVVDLAKLV
jgi:hypothetical protein